MSQAPARAGRRMLRLLALLLPTAAPLLADPPASPDPWYAANALYGDLLCLGVPSGQPAPVPGDAVHLIVQGQELAERKVLSVMKLDEARPIIEKLRYDGLSKDKELWAKMRCAWWFRGADAGSVATLEGTDTADFVTVLGLRELPSFFIVVPGASTPLADQELAALDRQLANELPRSCRDEGGRRLLAGRRFGPVEGYTLVEFTAGVPTYNPAGTAPSIKSIRICRFFLKNGALKAVDEQSRASGEEERVDTEAPELDEANWSETRDETMAYITRDGGCRWERLHSNGGFEGINYVVQSLEPGLPEVYHEYYYTAH